MNFYDKSPLAGLRPKRRGISAGGLVLFTVCVIVATISIMSWLEFNQKSAASQVETIPLVPTREAYAATPPAVAETPDPEAEARNRQLAMAPVVRQQLCADYGRRYVAATTSVDLAKAIQLSQAAGCGWQAIFHTDAETHDLSPEALAVALNMEAEHVPTIATSLADQEEKIDSIDSKVTDLKQKIEEMRWRTR